MLSRFARIFLAVALLVALWGLSMARRPGSQVWVHPLDTAHPGPVRILRFYASVGTLSRSVAQMRSLSRFCGHSRPTAPISRASGGR